LKDACKATEVRYVAFEGVDRYLAVDDAGTRGNKLRDEVLGVVLDGTDAMAVVGCDLVLPALEDIVYLLSYVHGLNGFYEARVEQCSDVDRRGVVGEILREVAFLDALLDVHNIVLHLVNCKDRCPYEDEQHEDNATAAEGLRKGLLHRVPAHQPLEHAAETRYKRINPMGKSVPNDRSEVVDYKDSNQKDETSGSFEEIEESSRCQYVKALLEHFLYCDLLLLLRYFLLVADLLALYFIFCVDQLLNKCEHHIRHRWSRFFRMVFMVLFMIVVCLPFGSFG
jgi:hypothetical protein